MTPIAKKKIAIVVALCAVAFCTVVLLVRAEVKNTFQHIATVSNLGDVREAFDAFQEIHGRWPISMDEVYGDKYLLEGTLTPEHCRDAFARAPFRCVTGENVYRQIESEYLRQVLVMSPKSFNDASWPKSKLRIYVLDSLGGISKISPSELQYEPLHINKAH
ncbi:hypothetical protein Q31b_23440 [Novipirellula aureliae]|uniref:Uncharacterized protein n=1 Tax=Novipirellula aureliae TaxID=2527966 RepID=A0A5C6E760_9BACT|nr:hypothetical protein [Novipirellula aureliae]TWU43306.1 hypothetical protein Q31b_23440 [Novipirellula aureliae]